MKKTKVFLVWLSKTLTLCWYFNNLVDKEGVDFMDSTGPTIPTFLDYYKLQTNFTSLQDCLIDYISWQYFGVGISLVQYVLPGTQDVVARSSDVYMADLVGNLTSFYNDDDFLASLSKISLVVAPFPEVQVITKNTTSSSIGVSVVFNVGTKTFFTGGSPTNQQAQAWLNAFFQDSLGKYSRGGEPVKTLGQCVVLATSWVVSPTSKNVIQVTCQVKPTFTMLVLGLSTSSLAYTWTEASFRQVFDQSSGLPSSITMPLCDATSSSACECTYYAVLYDDNQNYVECPGSSLYYCQYNTQCLCVVTRAVPEGTAMKDRINSRFAQCFDLACSQTSVDCSSECSQAKAWLSDPNWYSTFINPASLNVTAVQRVCNFDVAQVPMTRQPLRFSGLVVSGFVCAVLSVPLSVLGKSLLAQRLSLSWVDLVALVVILAVMVVGAYLASGIQTCLGDDFSSTNSGQATCTDRLLGKVKMSNKDCDLASPVFCQCNADTDNQRVCPLLPSCKCQNNQLCQSPTGAGDFVSKTSAGKSVRLQVVYLCLGAYFLLAPIVGILAYLLFFKRTPFGWVSKVGAWPGVLLVCLAYILLLGVAIIPCALITDDQTFVVNTTVQNGVCNLPTQHA